MELSLCMIVKNEEDVLERCLESVRETVEEIIIVDTGSTDKTEEIARKYTDHVYHFPWNEDFSDARNFAFSKATKEYCMWMDADDVLEQQDKMALLHMKKLSSGQEDVIMMRYHVSFDEQGKPVYSYYRERIVRNNEKYRFKGRVHEAITPSGNIVYSEIAVTHRKIHTAEPGRNLHIYEAQKEAGEAFSPRDQFYYGRELYFNGRYLDAIAVLETFLEEGKGWRENNIEACRTLALCYAKLEKRSKARQALTASFEYDIPRAEVCCDLGGQFMVDSQYEQAIFWYEQALGKKRDDTSGAFVSPDCYEYLPSIQLCVCYDRLGEIEKARQYNEKAGQFKPGSDAYQYNRLYFENRYIDNVKE